MQTRQVPNVRVAGYTFDLLSWQPIDSGADDPIADYDEPKFGYSFPPDRE